MHTKFTTELLKDETILWTGQPGPALFTPADIILVPFSLLWGALRSSGS